VAKAALFWKRSMVRDLAVSENDQLGRLRLLGLRAAETQASDAADARE
jgi:hypothetical protein